MIRPALGALLVVLPLTLGLRSAGQGERITDRGRLAVDAATSLAKDGWSVRQVEHHLFGWLIEGERGDCRILVHFASPEGSSYEKFRSLAQPIGPVTYHYRGEMSSEFPRLIPMLASHVQRYAWSFDLAIPTAPLVATARSAPCGTQIPDLTGLRQQLKSRPERVRA